MLASDASQFTDSSTVIASSRTILFGASWADGPCVAAGAHTVDDLQWGEDGSLLLSVGNGANYYTVDAGGLVLGLASCTTSRRAC